MSNTDFKKLQKEIADADLQKDFDNCCSEIEPCSDGLKKLADTIEDLCKQQPTQFVDKVQIMEIAIKHKCEEIKRQKNIVKQLMSKSFKDTKDFSSQTILEYATKENQTDSVKTVAVGCQTEGAATEVVEKEIVKEVEVIKEVVKPVEQIIEKPVIQELIKEVKVEIPIEVIKVEEKIIEVEKIIEKPIIQEKVVTVEKIIEKPIEVV